MNRPIDPINTKSRKGLIASPVRRTFKPTQFMINIAISGRPSYLRN